MVSVRTVSIAVWDYENTPDTLAGTLADSASRIPSQVQETLGQGPSITSLGDNQLVYAFWSCLQLERFVWS